MDDINVYLSYDQIELLISLVTNLQHHIDFLKLTQRDLLDARKRLIADKPKK